MERSLGFIRKMESDLYENVETDEDEMNYRDGSDSNTCKGEYLLHFSLKKKLIYQNTSHFRIFEQSPASQEKTKDERKQEEIS